MNTEFQPNGHIQKLIEKHGPNHVVVIKAIEFWGPEAGEFVIGDESSVSGLFPAGLRGGAPEELDRG